MDSVTVPKTARRCRRLARAGVALALFGSALAAGQPAAALAAPGPYQHSVSQVSAHLRMAVEIRPSQLAEYLSSSELVCGLGEKAAQRGDEGRAQANWTTLSQIVQELDQREMRAIDDAYVRADQNLLALKRTYASAWSGQTRNVRELKLGVARTREGIGLLRRAMDRIALAFSEWERHDCIGAVNGIEAGIRRIPAGLDKVNAGMQRLWRLPRT